MAINLNDILEITKREVGDALPIRALFRAISERWSVIPPNQRPEWFQQDFPLDVDCSPTALSHLRLIQKNVIALAPFFLDMDGADNGLVNYGELPYFTELKMKLDEIGKAVFKLPVHCSGHGEGGTGVYSDFVNAAVYWLKKFHVRPAANLVLSKFQDADIVYKEPDVNDTRVEEENPWGFPYEAKLTIDSGGTHTERIGRYSNLSRVLENELTKTEVGGLYSFSPISFNSRGGAWGRYYIWWENGGPSDISDPFSDMKFGFDAQVSCVIENVPYQARFLNATGYRAVLKFFFCGSYDITHRSPSERGRSHRSLLEVRWPRRKEIYKSNIDNDGDHIASFEETKEINCRFRTTQAFPYQKASTTDRDGNEWPSDPLWRIFGHETKYTVDGSKSWTSEEKNSGCSMIWGPTTLSYHVGAGHYITVDNTYFPIESIGIARDHYFDSFGCIPETITDGASAPPPIKSVVMLEAHSAKTIQFASDDGGIPQEEGGQVTLFPLKSDVDPQRLLEELQSLIANYYEVDISLSCQTRLLPILDYGEVFKATADDEEEDWLGLGLHGDSSGTGSSGT